MPNAAALSSDFRPGHFASDHYADEHEAGLIEKARALRSLLRQNMPKGDEQRSMTDEVFAALKELDLFSVMTPRRWGGRGMSSSAFARINREIAKGDPSVAWVVQIINGCTWIASQTSDELQADLFGGVEKNGGVPPRMCSSFVIPAPAKRTKGGYIVSGTWPYNSGCRQSDWGQYALAIEEEDGKTSFGHFAYIPLSEVTIIDTWYTAGMQGTSSDSAMVKDLFVPEHRIVRLEKSFGTKYPNMRHVGEPCDYWPVFPLIRSAGLGLILGAVEAALDMAWDGATKRGVANTFYAKQMDSAVVQRNLGECAAKLRAAELLIFDATGMLDKAGLAKTPPTMQERAQHKLQCALAIDLMAQALDKIMFTAGSSAFSLSNDLQHFWRDASVGMRHAINLPDPGYEIYGRAKFGIEPNICVPGLI